MVYIQMVMTAEKATKLGHDQVTRLEACFVVILLIFDNLFSCIFRMRDGNDFSQFGRTEVNETQGYAICCYKLFTILLVTLMQINYHRDYHSIVCHHLSQTNQN